MIHLHVSIKRISYSGKLKECRNLDEYWFENNERLFSQLPLFRKISDLKLSLIQTKMKLLRNKCNISAVCVITEFYNHKIRSMWCTYFKIYVFRQRCQIVWIAVFPFWSLSMTMSFLDQRITQIFFIWDTKNCRGRQYRELVWT